MANPSANKPIIEDLTEEEWERDMQQARRNTAEQAPRSAPPPPSLTLFDKLMNFLNATTLLSTVVFLLTGGWSYAAWTYALASAALVVLVFQFYNAGKPSLSLAYLSKFAGHESSHYLLYATTLLMGPPSILPLIPLAIYSFFNIASVTRATLQHYAPGAAGPLIRAITTAQTKQTQANLIANQMELMYLMTLILMVVSGQASFFQLVLYWHFIQQRYYAGSGFTRQIVTQLDYMARGFLGTKLPFLLSIYQAIARFLQLIRTYRIPQVANRQ